MNWKGRLTRRAGASEKMGLAAAAACVAIASPAWANLVITPTFDSSITSDANAGTIEAGINAAISRVEGDIANNVSSTITFSKVTSGLGESQTSYYTVPYSTYRSELTTQQTRTTNDNLALSSLPNTTNNPVNGSSSVNLQTTLARNLNYANYTGSDGAISLNTSIMNLSRTGSQNSNFYDLQAVAAHEIDEVLGIGGPGSVLQLSGSYTGQASPSGAVGDLDLYRYSANGVRSFTMDPNATSYFSINSGSIDIVHFNQNGAGGADFADWGTGVPGTGNTSSNTPPNIQDAFGVPGMDVNIGSHELTALDVVGYNLTSAAQAQEDIVPEPATFGLIAVATLGLRIRRRSISARLH